MAYVIPNSGGASVGAYVIPNSGGYSVGRVGLGDATDDAIRSITSLLPPFPILPFRSTVDLYFNTIDTAGAKLLASVGLSRFASKGSAAQKDTLVSPQVIAAQIVSVKQRAQAAVDAALVAAKTPAAPPGGLPGLPSSLGFLSTIPQPVLLGGAALVALVVAKKVFKLF